MNKSEVIFNQLDAFDDAEDASKAGNYVHIRIQQRNGRKSLTTVAGLSPDLDLKKILKYLKKAYSTNGTIIEDAEAGSVIQVQGDQRRNIYEALTQWNILDKDMVKVHGF